MTELIIYTAMKIVAIHAMCMEGHVLHRIGIPRLLWNAPVLIKKPLFECMMCMSSVWGITFWYIAGNSILNTELISFLLTLSGVMFILDILISFIIKKLNSRELFQ